LKSIVGMDEFCAKLAHYVRHAERGDGVLITRWGRPVARLGPAALKMDSDIADD
jgi:prevent-host-death family protein